MAPDIDVSLPPLLGHGNPQQAARQQFQPPDEADRALARADGLGMLEPVAEAAPEELGNPAKLRLVPAQLRLEVTLARRLMFEQPMEGQASGWNRYSDRRVLGQAVQIGPRKLRHQCIVSESGDTYQYW